jgi:hypothetical protein
MDTKSTNRFLGTKGLLVAGAMLALAVIFTPATAGAFEHIEHHHGGHDGHGGLFIGLGGPVYSGGYYTNQVQTVCVAPAHYERQWVPAQCETFTDSEGRVCTRVVREGYWMDVLVPAQYESRVVSVWVPAPAPSVGIGFGFHF